MAGWLPLESNPEVLNKFIHKLGVSEEWAFTDVFGLEPETLAWIPQPTKAIILLFPYTKAYEEHRKLENKRLTDEPQQIPSDLFYMHQTNANACGTVAIIHSVANNKDINLTDGILKKFLESAKDLSPEERGKVLENYKSISENHQSLALEGQTIADPDEKVYHHFIAFVNHNGTLYELDGRKTGPIQHGATNADSFVQDAAKVCKQFMSRDPEEVRFTVLALAAANA